MYQDDREAWFQRADDATRQADQLRRENEAMRNAMAVQPYAPPTYAVLPPGVVYPNLDIRTLPLPERARLANHGLTRFPVAATVILNILTFGLFGLIHFGRMHDRLPMAASNDPSTARSIGFQFIPYYNLYWVFFNSLRLCDRLDLQLKLRGRRRRAPRGLTLGTCVVSVIPYVNLLALLLLWPIVAGRLQSAVNEIAELPPGDWDPTQYDMSALPQHGGLGALPQPYQR